MGLTKKELVEYVRMAEHNQEVAEEALNQQAENVKDWMPVVHGRWEEPYLLYLVCSECGTGYVKYETYNYCPNCGAKMCGDGNG
jgi:rubrerythrin